ncbi:SPOR domain-containing protein [Nitrospirillum sp. BR 11164]|uniref:SPOR domain-containing protein n=1 Tax=Nitrospirillum sp. BR 11164 TaxID=3104324 RepID=UPI002AFF078F|nr:SPOR domain-containing protein [Nitrospirillum sp. BR 11164]MEA1652310.1 SPOR domain-containing protein [Nitrospirillum sp. BR 11164]
MSDMHDHHGDPDYDYDPGYDWQGRRQPAPRRRGLLSLGVVVAAVGSFGGLIYFVYTQGQRAGTEAVAPIIHADPGPTKVKPETPGGMDVPNQDRLIYDRLRADTKTDPGVERLLPPPEAPMERPTAPPPAAQPAPQQAPQAVAQAPAQVPAQAPAAQPAAPAAPPPTVLPPTTPGTTAPKPVTAAPVPAAKPPAQQQAAQANAPTPLAPPTAQPAPQPVVPKPVAAAPVTPTPKPAEKPVAPPAAAPASPGGGSVKLQFASIPSEPQAEAEMQRIQRKHAAILGGLSLRLVKADLGAKGIYYRVQAGPIDEAQAKRICEAVKAAKDGCIPVH